MVRYEKHLQEAYKLADKGEYRDALERFATARSFMRGRLDLRTQFLLLVGTYTNDIPPGQGFAYVAIRAADRNPELIDVIGSALAKVRGPFEELASAAGLKYGFTSRLPPSESQYLSWAAYCLVRVYNEVAERLERVGSPEAANVRKASHHLYEISTSYS